MDVSAIVHNWIAGSSNNQKENISSKNHCLILRLYY